VTAHCRQDERPPSQPLDLAHNCSRGLGDLGYAAASDSHRDTITTLHAALEARVRKGAADGSGDIGDPARVQSLLDLSNAGKGHGLILDVH
jgi:hypothetical protein